MSSYISYNTLYDAARIGRQAASIARSAQTLASTGQSAYNWYYPKTYTARTTRRAMNGKYKRPSRGQMNKWVARDFAMSKTYAKTGVIPPWNKGVTRVGGFYQGYSSNLGGELKFHDIDVDDATASITGTIQNTGTINIIAQGNTESTRIGRKSVIKAINWRYQLSVPELDAGGSPNSGGSLRVILYLDKQCNGATATVDDILETTNFQSFNQLANKNRFRILLDRIHDINIQALGSDNAGVISSAQIQQCYSFYKKCNIPIEFSEGTTGALTTMRSNNLGVLLIGSTTNISFDSKFRLRFTDS